MQCVLRIRTTASDGRTSFACCVVKVPNGFLVTLVLERILVPLMVMAKPMSRGRIPCGCSSASERLNLNERVECSDPPPGPRAARAEPSRFMASGGFQTSHDLHQWLA